MGLDQSTIPLGVGVYSFADAASLLGAPSREVRRWLLGYRFKRRDGSNSQSTGLWPRELPIDSGISFRDLLELRFVKAFRKHGVSLHAIRQAAAEARLLFKNDHPFTLQRFQTDGRDIFVSVHTESGDESLLDIVKHQEVFRQIIEPSLYDGIEFSQRGDAVRWFPLAGSKAVVLDPDRSFGKPLLTKSGVPTKAISEAVSAEDGDLHRVAKLYEITLGDVRHALAFEERSQAGD